MNTKFGLDPGGGGVGVGAAGVGSGAGVGGGGAGVGPFGPGGLSHFFRAFSSVQFGSNLWSFSATQASQIVTFVAVRQPGQ
jgi:hypothetical protein